MSRGPSSAGDLTRTDAYDYDLPPELVARYPAVRRDESRLLAVPRSAGAAGLRHLHFSDLPELPAPGDLLVLNESRVLPVRLLGRKPTGAASEVLLLRPWEGEDPAAQGAAAMPRHWEALVRPGSKLKPGRRVVVSDDPEGGLEVAILDGLRGGVRLVRLDTPLSVEEALERFGRVPLPPYLERDEEPLDRERYQTVYARTPGSVAAPTAGLHFTPELLARVEAGGVEIARVSLHVGPGTFRPVEAERIGDHEMHRERWEIPEATAAGVVRARERGGRVWAVGTTVVRTLESAAVEGEEGAPGGTVRAGSGETRLFIAPGYRFRVVDALVTNFHLPRSTLLMLVAAFAGHGATMAAYDAAIRDGYRFYSYGDAMAVVPG
jgi:S-adenosylmethionine:tRNA ribosyltransferase-isomerase